MASIIALLQKPYFNHHTFVYRLKEAIVFGVFVFLFLWLFRPFGIDNIDKNIFLVTFGFGLTTTVIMFILNIIVPAGYKSYFEEEKWTVGKEIFWSTVNILLIGFGNYLFFSIYCVGFFSWDYLLWFQGMTLIVGIFPVTIHVLWKESSERKKYESEAGSISAGLHQTSRGYNETNASGWMEIPSMNVHESLSLTKEELICIKGMDNYIEVHYFSEGNFKKAILRNTLKAMESFFEEDVKIFRCHKSYLINLRHVVDISGNAQGYRLHLEGLDITIPVSRSLNTQIKDILTIHP